jgi:hypothetical protein
VLRHGLRMFNKPIQNPLTRSLSVFISSRKSLKYKWHYVSRSQSTYNLKNLWELNLRVGGTQRVNCRSPCRIYTTIFLCTVSSGYHCPIRSWRNGDENICCRNPTQTVKGYKICSSRQRYMRCNYFTFLFVFYFSFILLLSSDSGIFSFILLHT